MWTTRYKPAGTPVFPLHDDPSVPSVLSALLADEPARQAVAWPAGFEGGICHRLDNPTSGAILVADDLAALAEAREQLRLRRLVKTYRLRVSRDPPWDANRCDREIGHDAQRKSRMIVQRGPNTPHRGRWLEAHTAFRRVSGRLFEAQMTTGVTHQIRVHAAFLGIALAGDRLYGGGPLPDDAPPGAAFLLHHVGLVGADGLATAPVPLPGWACAG